MHAIRLPHIRARINRLREIAEALGREVSRWRGQEGPLSPVERRRYLDGLHRVIGGLDDARDALAKAGARLESEGQ